MDNEMRKTPDLDEQNQNGFTNSWNGNGSPSSSLEDYLRDIAEDPSKIIRSVAAETDRYGKVFNDSIHGHIKVHPLLIKLIDTKEFQRLRKIKQLGMSSRVYIGANHTRFEHSIGVSHLAGCLVEYLADRHTELKISRNDVLSVQIAALLHDLGHGPYSHTWESVMKAVNPSAKWHHEETSIEMFDYMMETNQLFPVFESFGLSHSDLDFIRELISCALDTGSSQNSRPASKGFLYQIVANKLNSIDVDKWDYLTRDSRHVGVGSTFDFHRLMEFSRVLHSPDGKLCIAYRDKEVENVYDMFYVRCQMHKKVYQHRVTRVLEAMMVDVIKLADPYIKLKGKTGYYKMSDAYQDMEAFSRMNDGSIITLIENDERPQLDAAREILKRIDERRHYALLGRTVRKRTVPQNEFDENKIIDSLLASICDSSSSVVTANEFKKNIVLVRNVFDYGKDNKDPLKQVPFYDKNIPEVTKFISREEVSNLLPPCFGEMELLFFYRSDVHTEIEEAVRILETWIASAHDFKLKPSYFSTVKRTYAVVDQKGSNFQGATKKTKQLASYIATAKVS